MLRAARTQAPEELLLPEPAASRARSGPATSLPDTPALFDASSGPAVVLGLAPAPAASRIQAVQDIRSLGTRSAPYPEESARKAQAAPLAELVLLILESASA